MKKTALPLRKVDFTSKKCLSLRKGVPKVEPWDAGWVRGWDEPMVASKLQTP